MDAHTDPLIVPNDEAMRRLGGIGRTKFYELVDAKEIEMVKIGRRAFITTRSIAAYVDKLSQAAAV
jgi:hypothetical protein